MRMFLYRNWSVFASTHSLIDLLLEIQLHIFQLNCLQDSIYDPLLTLHHLQISSASPQTPSVKSLLTAQRALKTEPHGKQLNNVTTISHLSSYFSFSHPYNSQVSFNFTSFTLFPNKTVPWILCKCLVTSELYYASLSLIIQ